MSATLATVGLGMLKVASTAVSLSLVDRIGRRRALVVGITVMATSIAALAFYSFEQDSLAVEETCVEPLVNSSSSNANSNSSISSMTLSLNTSGSSSSCSEDSSASSPSKFNRYFAFTALVSFVCAYSFSFGPVTWVILSEIFPAATKGRAMALATSLNWAGNAFVSATFLDATGIVEQHFFAQGISHLVIYSFSHLHPRGRLPVLLHRVPDSHRLRRLRRPGDQEQVAGGDIKGTQGQVSEMYCIFHLEQIFLYFPIFGSGCNFTFAHLQLLGSVPAKPPRGVGEFPAAEARRWGKEEPE